MHLKQLGVPNVLTAGTRLDLTEAQAAAFPHLKIK